MKQAASEREPSEEEATTPLCNIIQEVDQENSPALKISGISSNPVNDRLWLVVRSLKSTVSLESLTE